MSEHWEHRRLKVLLARLYAAMRPSLDSDGVLLLTDPGEDYLIERPRIAVVRSTLGESLKRAVEKV